MPALTGATMPLQRRKIAVSDLQVGMQVVELDRPWLETPFLFQGFEVRTQADIDALARYCRDVFVVTAEPDAVPTRRAAPRTAAVPARAASAARGNIELEQRLLKINNRPGTPAYADLATLEQEMPQARRLYRETLVLAHEVMEDTRMRHGINAPGAKKAVRKMVESVIRNPDALACFIHIREKEEYTAQHSLRVSILAMIFGRHLGFDREQLECLGIGGLLHDVGKTRVPTEILVKPGPLTEPEKTIVRQHVPWGVEILENTPGIPHTAIEVTRNHHERYGGVGYAQGLKGDQIGTFGLIGGIVDCYDAISSDRFYRLGLSPHDALKRMYEWRERSFHPHLVEQFIQCMGIYPIGSVVELNTGEIGVVVAMNRERRLRPRVALVLDANHRPYASASLVDLVQSKAADGRAREIEHVVPPSTYHINPTQYLPIVPN
jgi:putative nucleotidyltransferase with HDIG domain